MGILQNTRPVFHKTVKVIQTKDVWETVIAKKSLWTWQLNIMRYGSEDGILEQKKDISYKLEKQE
jgi:hypothetical protein